MVVLMEELMAAQMMEQRIGETSDSDTSTAAW